ncbi:MAG TPA: DNA-binding domain-containing protein [Steroidobacteraceae bacterium]
MNLHALQLGLVDHLLQGSNAISTHIRGDAASRLAVYHNAYRMQLLACLRDTFEKTWSWLGDTAFDRAGLHHIERHPPNSWTLGDYGRDFGETLGELYPEDPEVSEIAWLDWNLRRAFDGANAASIEPNQIASVDWDRARLRLAPTLNVTAITTNCASIWTALAESKSPPAATLLETPMALRVWRQGLRPRYRSIDPEEHRALRMALGDDSFGTICSKLAAGCEVGTAAEAAGAMLSSWLQDGLIVGID